MYEKNLCERSAPNEPHIWDALMKTAIKSAIGRVTAGKDAAASIGTAFLVAKRYALTALHVVGNRELMINGTGPFLEPITIHFEGIQEPSQAKVVEGCWDATNDWALLELEKDFTLAEPMQLAILPEGVKVEFESFGYPLEHGSLTVAGVVRDAKATYFDATVIQLFSEELAAGEGVPLNGLSGAPCVVGHYAVGLVRASPLKEKREFDFSKAYTVKNGVLYACPPTQLAAICGDLLPPPIQLSFESVQRLIDSEASLASLKHYKRAIQRLCRSLPYSLPGGGGTDMETSYVDLNGSIPQDKKPPLLGSATQLVAQALRQKNVVTLIAPPGAGKTSLLHFWGRVLWDEPERAGFDSARLVVLCRFRDLARTKGGTVSERMRTAIGSIPALVLGGTGIPDDFLASWPEQTKTKLLFLFDGFDETPQEIRNDVAEWLYALLGEFPNAEFVLTSRGDKATFENTPFAFEKQRSTYIVLESPTRMQSIAIASGAIPQDADHFISRVAETGLHDILTTPLGIALAAAVYTHDGVLPEARASLYDRYIELALANATRQGMKEQSQLDAPQVWFLMERLAWTATETGELSEADALRVVSEGLRELVPTMSAASADTKSESIWEILKERSGIFVTQTEWKHETFREFLAARYLSKTLDPDSDQMIALLKQQTDPGFHGMLLFVFSIWSTQKDKCNETVLDTYRRLFEHLIGKTAEQDSALREGGSWRNWFKSLVGTTATAQNRSDYSARWEDVIFSAEVLLELGKAPIDIEKRILELLFQHGRKRIEETFIHPGYEVTSLNYYLKKVARHEGIKCSDLFASPSIMCPEKGILRRWCRQPQLNTLLDVWADSWQQDLIQGTDDATGPAGLLVLSQRYDQIAKLLDQDLINVKTCEGVAKALMGDEGTDSRTCQYNILRKLESELFKSNERMVEVASFYKTLVDAKQLLPTDKKLIKKYPFYRWVAAWAAAFAVPRPDKRTKVLYPHLLREAVAAYLGPDEMSHLQTVSSKMIASEATPLSPLLLALASLSRDQLKELADDIAFPIGLREFVKWYILHQDQPATDQQTILSFGHHLLTSSAKLREDCALVMRHLPAEILLEELARQDVVEGLALEIVKLFKTSRDIQALINFGLSGNGKKSARVAALTQAYEFEPSEMMENHILSLEPTHIPTLRKRAERLENADQLDAAEKELDGILKLSPQDGAALESRARIKLNTDRYESALVDITEALKSQEDSGYRLYLRGRIFQKQEQWRDAIASFDAAQVAGNSEYRLYLQRGNTYYSLGLLNDAIKEADTVLTDDASHNDARMLKAVSLSSLGEWGTSEALLVGKEETLSEHSRWFMTRFQNMLGLGKLQEAREFLASLGEAYKLSFWEETIVMFYENAVIGSLSQSRLLKLQEAIAKDQTLRQIRFWVLLATGDHSGCKELVRQLMNGKREDDLRWIAIDGKTTLKGFLPSWASALIDEADAAAASIAVQTTPTAISEQKQLAEPLTDTHAPEQRRTQRKVKDRIENGMLCRAYKIDTYEEELEMAKGILEPHHATRTMVVIPLLNTGHIYIQANVKDEDSDWFNFKMVGPYVKFRDNGVLERTVKDKHIQKVLVTDQGLYQRLTSHPSLKSIRKLLVLEEHSLPYTSSEVEFN